MNVRDEIMPLYLPQEQRPMQVVTFGSGSGTNLQALISAQKYIKEELGKPLYEIKAIVCDRPCNCLNIGEREGISTLYIDFKDFFKQKGIRDYTNQLAREAYDSQILQSLSLLARTQEFSIDLIILAGYMRILYEPLLDFFKQKIINVHPADLSKKNEDGKPLYAGQNGVLSALLAGEKKTYSSVHIVTKEVDTGQVIVTSKGLAFPDFDKEHTTREDLEGIAIEHQKQQKQLCDWPALVAAVSLIAQGRIATKDGFGVYVDKQIMPCRGFELEKYMTKERIQTDIALRAAAKVMNEEQTT